MTQEQALLALVADLYAQIGALQRENEELTRQLSEAKGQR